MRWYSGDTMDVRYKTAIGILVAVTVVISYWWHMLVWNDLFQQSDQMRIHFLDVGQGDAIVIETPNNRRVLVDAGRSITTLSALDEIIPANDRNIAVAVMTHPDTDHIGGFIPVLERYQVNTVLRSPTPSKTDVYDQVIAAVQKEGADSHSVKRPYTFSLDGVQFDILWPIDAEIPETNAASIVLLVSYGTSEILLTGDVPSEVEEFLITIFPQKLNDIEILKAGHHGSKTSTAQAFLNHTKPNAIIYSAEKGNTYGHPHTDTLERVKTYAETHTHQNLREYYTADGTISFCVTQTGYMLCN